MKKTLALLLLVAASSNAAKFETCMKEVSKACGTYAANLANYQTAGHDCAVVQGGKREDGTKYSTKVIFKDNDTLVSLTTDYGSTTRACEYNKINIFGKFKETKQLEGRLFALTQSGEVIVVTRTNEFAYMLNAKNKPYSSVKDIKIDQPNDKLSLTFENGQTNDYSLMDVLEKVNNPKAKIQN